ncbi:MAG: hypothetical protein IJ591_07195, partial [Lachnospiraceae bacterium]|nr:hypothetical protein [Lachnospiraceae bacterium]
MLSISKKRIVKVFVSFIVIQSIFVNKSYINGANKNAAENIDEIALCNNNTNENQIVGISNTDDYYSSVISGRESIWIVSDKGELFSCYCNYSDK